MPRLDAAGGGGDEGQASIAETPAYVLAIVLLFFLVISLSFEYIVHALRDFLTRRKRPGLVQALEKVVSEVTLLGLVSLILTVAQDGIGKVCIKYSEGAIDWTQMHAYDGCPCCLENTADVTTCAQIYYGCSFNITSALSEPYCGCDDGIETYENQECALLPPPESECEGPFPQGACSDGHMTAISIKALNQMHLFVFLAAILHATSALLVVLLASIRMRQWRRWQADILKENGEQPFVESLSGIESSRFPLSSTVEGGPGEALDARFHQGEERGDAEGSLPPRSTVLACDNDGQIAAEISPGSNGTLPIHIPPSLSSHLSSSAIPVDTEGDQITKAARDAKRLWMRRSTFIVRKRSRVAEVLVCVAQSFYPNMISRSEFRLMRESYLDSHGLPADYNFLAECNQQLDRNCGSLVGLSLEMWLVWIISQLLMGVADWANNIFLAVGTVGLFIVNIILVAMIRYACRGGHSNELRPARRWYKNPKLMAIPLRSLIFLCALILSTDAFYAWQMGPKSCFFVAGSHTVWNNVEDGFAWWVGLVWSLILLTWTAIVTVPAWTMCIFTRLDEDSSLAETTLEGGRHEGGVATKGNVNGVAADEEETEQVAGGAIMA